MPESHFLAILIAQAPLGGLNTIEKDILKKRRSYISMNDETVSELHHDMLGVLSVAMLK